jgi:hypothetical protein
MKEESKLLHFTRGAGGTFVKPHFQVKEVDLEKFKDKVELKEVFSKQLNQKLKTRVVKIGKAYVHALFFDNGNIYDCKPDGFKIREAVSIKKEAQC